MKKVVLGKALCAFEPSSDSNKSISIDMFESEPILQAIITNNGIYVYCWFGMEKKIHWHLNMAPLKRVELWGYFTPYSREVGWLIVIGN